jgi:hypothetical protein
MMNLALQSIIFLTCPEILQHGADGFISSPKQVFLRIFIALGRVSTREPWN